MPAAVSAPSLPRQAESDCTCVGHRRAAFFGLNPDNRLSRPGPARDAATLRAELRRLGKWADDLAPIWSEWADASTDEPFDDVAPLVDPAEWRSLCALLTLAASTAATDKDSTAGAGTGRPSVTPGTNRDGPPGHQPDTVPTQPRATAQTLVAAPGAPALRPVAAA